MIKQDYLIRMIQEIINLIVDAILNKKKIRRQEWTEYDRLTQQILGFSSKELLTMNREELIDRYNGDSDKMNKLELAAINMLKLSEDMKDNVLLKSKLSQDALQLLKYVQEDSEVYSLQRDFLIKMLEINK